MKLGYSITSAVPSDTAAADASAAVLDRATVAVDAGYDYVQAGDHHAVAGGGYLQNVPITARLTEVADRVSTMFLLPVWDPVIVAEQVGTLATLADVVVWFAIGRANQTEAMGVPGAERVPRMEEALTLLERLWNEDDVTFDGEFYSVTDLSVNPKADPRVVIGGTAEPAVRRAGRFGDAWVAAPTLSTDALTERIEWFDEAGGGDVVARRDALVLSNGERARELATETLENGYRGWPADADYMLAGDADEVAVELETLRDAGVDEVVVRPMLDEYADETLREVARGRDRT